MSIPSDNQPVQYSPGCSLPDLLSFYNDSIPVLCNRCGRELLFVLNQETSRLHKLHYGIYCPLNKNHVRIMLSMRPKSL